jgi:hypothetical protein
VWDFQRKKMLSTETSTMTGTATTTVNSKSSTSPANSGATIMSSLSQHQQQQFQQGPLSSPDFSSHWIPQLEDFADSAESSMFMGSQLSAMHGFNNSSAAMNFYGTPMSNPQQQHQLAWPATTTGQQQQLGGSLSNGHFPPNGFSSSLPVMNNGMSAYRQQRFQQQQQQQMRQKSLLSSSPGFSATLVTNHSNTKQTVGTNNNNGHLLNGRHSANQVQQTAWPSTLNGMSQQDSLYPQNNRLGTLISRKVFPRIIMACRVTCHDDSCFT